VAVTIRAMPPIRLGTTLVAREPAAAVGLDAFEALAYTHRKGVFALGRGGRARGYARRVTKALEMLLEGRTRS
jgi:hypothetical protein